MNSGATEDSLDPRVRVWNKFVERANELIESGNLERWENRYKRDVALDFAAARTAILDESDEWAAIVKKARTQNLIHHVPKARFHDWIDQSPHDARKALQAIWTEDYSSVSHRVRAFCAQFPQAVISGRGTRMNLVSVLLMGIDASRYPPFMITAVDDRYRRTDFERPHEDADEAALYGHFLGFLDRFIDEARAHGVHLRHRLDAQGVVWQLRDELPRLAGRRSSAAG